ncbi:MAG TPA: PAS domain-containing protein, partial [Candidatus Omnitrophota bacterium]|nr:PAS domain-containing protein [Candidatus Omnitrophota bacterium]
MLEFSERITRALTIRYIAVLAVLGALAIASFLALARLVADVEGGSALINMAGRQRMLVERAALLSIQLPGLAEDSRRRQVAEQLADVLDQLEGAHLGLTGKLPIARTDPPSESLRGLYFGPAGDVDARLKDFLARGRALATRAEAPLPRFDADAAQMVAAAEGPLMQGLEAVVRQHQGEVQGRMVTLTALHGAALVALLLVLMLSAAVVFQPMVRRIRDDIADRSKAERGLRESEERLWRILEESPVGVSVSRRSDGRVVFINNRFSEIVGAKRSEIIGRSARDLFVDDAQRRRVVAELKRKGRIDDAEVEFRRRDGTPFHSLLNISATHFEGEAVNLAWIYDISAIRKTEEKLKLVAKVVDTASEAVVITNSANRIEYVNPAFTTITEYGADEVVGQNPKMLQSGRHDGDFYRTMWQTIAEKGRWRGEIWNRRKSGEFYAEWLSIVAIKDDAGNLTHHIAVFSDITHRKEDEERVWRQANFDALTGLPNRALFLDRLAQAVRQARRDGKKFALMFIDLDGFKQVNDTLGHAAGNILLQQTSGRLTECMRASDTVARLAGDEFTVILQGIHGREDAAIVAGKILDKLSQPFDL